MPEDNRGQVRAVSARGRVGARLRAALPLALLAGVSLAGCVGAKPKPPEPGLGPAAVPVTAPSPGPEADSLRIYLMTFGPGGEVWEHFGHTALWVHDPVRGTDLAYNYGMFDFSQAHFFRRFLEGKMLYWMQGFDTGLFANLYIRQDRSVWVQELALTPAQREALREFLVWNARPENRFYRYDYYRDGCATRVRDALDRVLGGRIYAETRALPSGSTYRSHSLRLVEDAPWAYTGMLLGLGQPTDRPISLWEEMFLPLKLRETLRRVTVPAPDGHMVPLVESERTVYASTRPAEPGVPPERTWKYLLLGGAIAALLAGLGEAVRRTRATAAPNALSAPAPRRRVAAGAGAARGAGAAGASGNGPGAGDDDGAQGVGKGGAVASGAGGIDATVTGRATGGSGRGRKRRRKAAAGSAAVRRSLPNRAARAAFALMGSLWCLLTGALGLFLIVLWAFTAHVTSQHNENVLQFDALALALLVLLPAALYGARWAARPARWLAAAIAGLSLLGLLLKLTPWFWQVNGPILALAVPANLGLAWAVWRAVGETAPEGGKGAA